MKDQLLKDISILAETYSDGAATHRDIALGHPLNSGQRERHMKTALAFKNKAEGAWAAYHLVADR